jgi:HD-GYP domain-containing protein (c-di-GMP phosphodiesterase class II)
MNIRRLVKYSFALIALLVLLIFSTIHAVLYKVKEDNYIKKYISELILMQENMNLSVKDVVNTNNINELNSLKKSFNTFEYKFENLRNSFLSEEDDFIDIFIKDIHKSKKIQNNLLVISQNELKIEEAFETIFILQSEKIMLDNLFDANYPLENTTRKILEEEVLKTKDLVTIKKFSDVKYYSKEVLFQYKEQKYLDKWLEKILVFQKSYNNSLVEEYISIVQRIGGYAVQIKNIEEKSLILQNEINKILSSSKDVNIQIANDIEQISQDFISKVYVSATIIFLLTLIFIGFFSYKVSKNVGLSFDEVEAKVEDGLTEINQLYKELEDTQKEVIFTMGAIGESRSKETGNHVKRVAEYSKLLALYYGLDEKESNMLKQASPMHDIGKVAIPDAILNKPAKFTIEEFEIMKKHSFIGYDMLKHSNRQLLKTAAIVAYEHHEKYDGSGYPRGLIGEEIHIYGRITAIADVFDALGSDRCYKRAWELDKILNLFQEEKGKHFDPVLIDLFFENLDEFLKIRENFKDI